jgi:biotin operon repressor
MWGHGDELGKVTSDNISKAIQYFEANNLYIKSEQNKFHSVSNQEK